MNLFYNFICFQIRVWVSVFLNRKSVRLWSITPLSDYRRYNKLPTLSIRWLWWRSCKPFNEETRKLNVFLDFFERGNFLLIILDWIWGNCLPLESIFVCIHWSNNGSIASLMIWGWFTVIRGLVKRFLLLKHSQQNKIWFKGFVGLCNVFPEAWG